jgi:hypothetical protein
VGDAAFESERPYVAADVAAAVVICRPDGPGSLHTGLLYRGAGASTAVLHLGWEDRVSDEWDWPRLWASPEVEPERLASVAALCRRIWTRFVQTRTFPYGLGLGATIDPITGSVVPGGPGPGARGLTCATLAVQAFRAVGIEMILVDDSWPVREQQDRAFLARIQRFCSPPMYEALKADVDAGCKRIQPQEVVAACAVSPLPARFKACDRRGKRVLAKLDGVPFGFAAKLIAIVSAAIRVILSIGRR